MDYMSLSIEELHEKLVKKEVSSKELIEEALKKSHEVQEKYNAFVTILDDAKETEITESMLSGIPYGVKDNYSTKGILTTGSSNTLKDYVPFFSATAVENLEKAGAVPVNKTVLDELAMGGTGTTGHTGAVLNPWDKTRMCSGSSAGSACAVASGVYPYALGSDTGDSVRKPAAYCGVVGYQPTYGMISRYGVLPYASSLDHCGALARSVKDVAIVVDAMKGIDEKDMTTWNSKNIHLYKSLNGDVKGKKLCYIKEICDIENYENPNKDIIQQLENFKKTLELCKKLGMEVEEVSFDRCLLDALTGAYMAISCGEATSNLANLTSIIFGPRAKGKNYIEIMRNYRTEGFSPLIKRRFIIGSYALQSENKERYFNNAQRVRRLIVNKCKEIFSKYDAIILPIDGPAKPLKDENVKLDNNMIAYEGSLKISNMGGFPSIAIPNGFIDGLPAAISITGNCFEDEKVLNIAYSLESAMPYKGQIAKEVAR